ncbi:mannonate dehydratase [Paenibacillus psychroresistens]|uniref:mannonate dehydratase n=1 Tax=Paenibacillus psychroresistens TaxID=1778678 RepID=A0A6B8RDN8_9BACL|nr:mannonate dehydratase [Paenibacillus psychroresistens]QGQ94551.1 mannonate dehydratase [Paenibacillus psychroresistens]
MKIAEVLNAYPDRLWQVAKQAGVTHVVSRMPLHKDGTPSVDYMDLLHMKKRYEDFGLKLEVFEPGLEWQIHKTRLGIAGREEEIAMFKTLIRHMGTLGVPVLCYNFMAVFNWIRTSVSVPERGGAYVTGYDHSLMKDAPITDAGTISEDQLWENLRYFMKEVVPVAEQAKVKLALHPCDPPLSPIRGIARIITSADAMQQAIDLVPSEYNGVTFCQGTFATAGENIPQTIERFGKSGKIFYIHFRDIRGTAESFTETFHDNGQTDMFAAIQAYKAAGFDGAVRVDHVPTMAGESNQDPGYESMGRLYALGYLRGLLDGAAAK